MGPVGNDVMFPARLERADRHDRRLLGIGHAPWLALVPWAWYRSQALPEGSWMSIWLIALVVLNTGSLLIDAVDVVRYLRGEREPYLAIDKG